MKTILWQQQPWREVSYEVISDHFCRAGGRPWSMEECRQRVAFHTNRVAGGTLLPTEWETADAGLPDTNGSYLNTLFPDEYHELALYVSRKKGLFTEYIFRPHVTAARLRACLREMEKLSEERGDLFAVDIAQHGSKEATRRRREHARKAYPQRIAKINKWTAGEGVGRGLGVARRL